MRVQAEHDPVVAGRTFDVSQGGLGAWLARELPVGQQVQLEFIMPGMETPLRLPAVVRYSAGQHCGFSFGELRPGERAILRRYCEGWTKLS